MKRVTKSVCVLALALPWSSGCDQGQQSCADGETRVAGECVATSTIHLNAVGFLPDQVKRATVPAAGVEVVVHRADGSEALRVTASDPLDGDVAQHLAVADFSELQETGQFYLAAPGVGRSPEFRIAPDVHLAALETVLLGLHGQRCGAAVSFTHAGSTFSHYECHTEDAWVDHVLGRSEIRPSLRGWHDAGDYGKYVLNGAFAAGMMLAAWEHFGEKLSKVSIPGTSGELPDYLDELKWQLDWLLTTQLDDGSASHKVTAHGFEGLDTEPHADFSKRYYAPAGSAATAAFVAVMASTGRLYATVAPEFAASCLDAARRGWTWLENNPNELQPDLSAFTTGAYNRQGDEDDRLWAAAELWETTGEPAFLAAFEKRAAGRTVRLEWDWGNVENLGLFTYLLSNRDGRDPAVVERLQTSLLNVADNIVSSADHHAFGRGIGSSYYWGINGTVVRTTLNLEVAHRLANKPEYRRAALQQIDHVLGRNVYGRSQVTGLGHHPPQAPHHRPSAADDVNAPWPGLLVGGAHPEATSWVDETTDYRTNEVAINWNAALVYALAGFLP